MSWIQIALLILGWLLVSIGAGLAWLPAGLIVAGLLILLAVFFSVRGEEEVD